MNLTIMTHNNARLYPDLHEYPKTISISYCVPRSIADAKKAIQSEYPGCSYQLLYSKGHDKILAKTKKSHPKIASGVQIQIAHPSFWSEVWDNNPDYDHGWDDPN